MASGTIDQWPRALKAVAEDYMRFLETHVAHYGPVGWVYRTLCGRGAHGLDVTLVFEGVRCKACLRRLRKRP